MGSSVTFLFAGGGTGGHLFPGIAVAQELLRRHASARVVFVGSTRAIESTIVAEQGFEHRVLPAEPLTTLKRNPLRFVWRNWQAWRGASRLLSELRPAAVIGLGGYASAPLVWAASHHHIPVILLEQNVIPGRTTRWLSRYADRVCVTFPETCSRLPRARNVIVTGNAVRNEIAALRAINRTSSAKLELLILGGSQGADSLNEAVLSALRHLNHRASDWSLVHQTGPRQVDQIRKMYLEMGWTAVVEPFFHDMPTRYSSADLAISRAGASTLTELACAGIPMILLPFPHAADDHQRANAKVFFDQGSAIVVEHASTAEDTGNQLSTVLAKLLDDPERRQTMGIAAKKLASPDAVQRITDVIEQARDSKQKSSH